MRTARPVPFLAAPARLLAAVLALIGAVLLVARPALAAGTVTIADRAPQEDDGRWKLKMTINYGAEPHLAHIPMIFSFTPTVHYERALTDQSPEKPVLNRIPLQGQQSINESMDVGFSDGTGKIFKITKFDFILRRDRGFEAGEYDLKITRVGDGVQMGQVQKLTLKGENPIVDRRAIVFAGEKKPKKEKKEEPKEAGESGEASPEPDPAAAEPTPDESGETPIETPPEVPPQGGGCGCRVAGAADPVHVWGLRAAALAGVVVVAALRRRRRAA
jgi:MYXO-CTERM domain-containing protein